MSKSIFLVVNRLFSKKNEYLSITLDILTKKLIIYQLFKKKLQCFNFFFNKPQYYILIFLTIIRICSWNLKKI